MSHGFILYHLLSSVLWELYLEWHTLKGDSQEILRSSLQPRLWLLFNLEGTRHHGFSIYLALCCRSLILTECRRRTKAPLTHPAPLYRSCNSTPDTAGWKSGKPDCFYSSFTRRLDFWHQENKRGNLGRLRATTSSPVSTFKAERLLWDKGITISVPSSYVVAKWFWLGERH